MTRPPFPEVLDSSMISSLSSCPTQFWYAYGHNLVPKGTVSVHLLAGGALATGFQRARESYHIGHKAPDDAMADGYVALTDAYGTYEPEHEYRAKSWERTAISYASYWNEYPLAGDYIRVLHFTGVPAIEFSFALPLPIAHPTTGNPLLFAGRLDWLGQYKQMMTAMDEKSSGRDVSDRWDLRGQFQAYMYACNEYGFPVKCLIVRRIIMHVTETKFRQVIVYHKEWAIKRWFENTMRKIERAIDMWRDGSWEMSLGDACNAYGGCAFTSLCEAEDPEPWININYEKRTWSPLRKIA